MGAAAVRQFSSPFDWTYSTDYQGTVEGFKVSSLFPRKLEKLEAKLPLYVSTRAWCMGF